MTGDVDTVLVRGTVVVDDGELRVEPGFGEFLERAKFGEELHRAAAQGLSGPGGRRGWRTRARA